MTPTAWLIVAAGFAVLAVGIVIGCLIAASREIQRDEWKERRARHAVLRDLHERGVR